MQNGVLVKQRKQTNVIFKKIDGTGDDHVTQDKLDLEDTYNTFSLICRVYFF